MPVRKVKGGYRVGRGKATYKTRSAANRANRAAHARKKRKRK